MLPSFLRSTQGNFAVITALAALPLFGAMGMAVDFSRASNAQILIQDKADIAAIAVARQGPTASDFTVYNAVAQQIRDESNLTDIEVTGRWSMVNEYEVTVKGGLPLTITRIMPGIGQTMPVSAVAVARYRAALLKYKAPTMTLLDPEAGDYNRVFAYCFNKDKKSDPTTHGRSQEIAIADNGGTNYKVEMPVCAAGETLSFRLFNVRNSRTTKKNWDNPKIENYSYYTDTVLKPAETYDLDGWPILETVLCPSLDLCKPTNQGGVIPYGKNRTPVRATEACAAGKFMYYGWEDRPPGRGDSDRDYDDIRVIIECPSWELVGAEMVRLIE